MINVRSLFNRVDKLSIILPQHQVDVAVFVKTWLSEATLDSALGVHGYTIFRNDRASGGGG